MFVEKCIGGGVLVWRRGGSNSYCRRRRRRNRPTIDTTAVANSQHNNNSLPPPPRRFILHGAANQSVTAAAAVNDDVVSPSRRRHRSATCGGGGGGGQRYSVTVSDWLHVKKTGWKKITNKKPTWTRVVAQTAWLAPTFSGPRGTDVVVAVGKPRSRFTQACPGPDAVVVYDCRRVPVIGTRAVLPVRRPRSWLSGVLRFVSRETTTPWPAGLLLCDIVSGSILRGFLDSPVPKTVCCFFRKA